MEDAKEYAFVIEDAELLADLMTAAVSDNETVRSALDVLVVAVRIAEPELLDLRRRELRESAAMMTRLRAEIERNRMENVRMRSLAQRETLRRIAKDMKDRREREGKPPDHLTDVLAGVPTPQPKKSLLQRLGLRRS